MTLFSSTIAILKSMLPNREIITYQGAVLLLIAHEYKKRFRHYAIK